MGGYSRTRLQYLRRSVLVQDGVHLVDVLFLQLDPPLKYWPVDLEVLEGLEPLKLSVEGVHHCGVYLGQEHSELSELNAGSTAIDQLA